MDQNWPKSTNNLHGENTQRRWTASVKKKKQKEERERGSAISRNSKRVVCVRAEWIGVATVACRNTEPLLSSNSMEFPETPLINSLNPDFRLSFLSFCTNK